MMDAINSLQRLVDDLVARVAGTTNLDERIYLVGVAVTINKAVRDLCEMPVFAPLPADLPANVVALRPAGRGDAS